ncbi:hypothetical protein BIW53_09330 [Pseudoalteromonas byunsanensis]|uniref:Uncharacterized protein n=1 Tax=Pseudoalteromonas byunsanensis TaxID=327939 RepID=A0A1S1N9F4_9GAMM|nr:hypothetical protein BIW53_09330 [Pseudoalteromonas byunsanensis]
MIVKLIYFNVCKPALNAGLRVFDLKIENFPSLLLYKAFYSDNNDSVVIMVMPNYSVSQLGLIWPSFDCTRSKVQIPFFFVLNTEPILCKLLL